MEISHALGGFHADQVQRGGDGLTGGARQLQFGGAGGQIVVQNAAFIVELVEGLCQIDRVAGDHGRLVAVDRLADGGGEVAGYSALLREISDTALSAVGEDDASQHSALVLLPADSRTDPKSSLWSVIF